MIMSYFMTVSNHRFIPGIPYEHQVPVPWYLQPGIMYESVCDKVRREKLPSIFTPEGIILIGFWYSSSKYGKRKNTISQVGFGQKCGAFIFLSLCSIGLRCTEHLSDAALTTNHGASSLPGTHHQLSAACYIDTSTQHNSP